MNFSILDWSAFSPGLTSPEAWATWAETTPELQTEGQPDVKFLPLMMRRRLGRLSKMAIWSYYQIEEQLRLDRSLVFSSRHGDSSATNEILEIIATKAEISPADFSLSVHNAFPGQVSIHTKNKRPYTAISAGAESFSMGLFEAVSLSLEQDQPLLYCYVENDLNPKFQKYLSQKIPPHAITFCLQAHRESCPDTYEVTCQNTEVLTGSNIPSLDFLKWFLRPESSELTLSQLLFKKTSGL